MTNKKTAAIEPGGVKPEDARATTGQFRGDVGAFLAALATLLRETIVNFEQTVGRISEIVVKQSGSANRDLIVSLQDFDRLQQEFVTLVDVLARLASTPSGLWSHDERITHSGRDAIAAIAMSDIKERLVHHLEGRVTGLASSPMPDDEIF